MKKIYLTCQALCLSLALIVGCKQEESLQPDANAAAPTITKPLESMSREEPLAHYKANLTSLGQVAAQLGKEAAFRQLLYKKIEERFDGDYNVLFKQLGEVTLDGEKVLNRMQQLSPSGRVSATSAMSAFFNIKGQDFFPQVFIPFYDELKAAGKLGKQQVEIVIHPGDDTVNEAPGYALNERNELVPTGKMVNEAYLRENEVWVISLNERVTSLAELAALGAPAKTDKAGRTQAGTGFKFEWMRLKEHMEGIFSGENDVRFTGALSYVDWKYPGSGESHYPQYLSPYGLESQEGRQVAKWSKSETSAVNDANGSRGLWKVVNWQFLELTGQNQNGAVGWRFPGDYTIILPGDWLWFAIFEHDGHPEGVKYVKVTNPVSPYKSVDIPFRSSQGACASKCLGTSQYLYTPYYQSNPYYMGGFESYYNTDRVEYNIMTYP